jgi:shikimate dehydrogenase
MDIVAQAVNDCLDAELGVRVSDFDPSRVAKRVRVAAVGATASQALSSPLLASALAGQDLWIETARAFDDPTALLVEVNGWDFAVVLSPFKRHLSAGIASPSAAEVGVTDTLVRLKVGLIAVNTNSWAIAAALRALVRSGSPRHVLVLGAGATARSIALGTKRTWPAVRLTVSARKLAGARELAAMFHGEAVDAAATPDVKPDVIINATTWGETAESEAVPFAFPFEALIRPAAAFLDLNNRRSALQEQALAGSMVVMSGTLMQVITHACRAALARVQCEEREHRVAGT